MPNSPFTIYNASAGSGKTFTLVKEYLKILFLDPSNSAFKYILAITFTNKAVNEMKKRILDMLAEFSKNDLNERSEPLFHQIVKETGLKEQVIIKRSESILKEILHNYAFFDVVTIDRFTHRIIRTFAKDLNLPQNFEVVLDQQEILDEAIHRLISRSKPGEVLSDFLIEFAISRTDDDKSWNIIGELADIGKMLFVEDHIEPLEKLKDKDLGNFRSLWDALLSRRKGLEKTARDKASQVLHTIEQNGFEKADFPRGTLINHFQKIESGIHDEKLYINKLGEQIESGNILNKKANKSPEPILPLLRSVYPEIKDLVFKMIFLDKVIKNLVPMTLLNAIRSEIDMLQESRAQLLISEFNKIISNEIKNQPAPFIYERLGEKYRHFFVDEFQDTSRMQWDNLKPLLSHILASADGTGSNGSLTLVGDPKQSIYRFRGGHVEQFVDLLTGRETPFVYEPRSVPLNKNYRSYSEIIGFNNRFFASASSLMSKPEYRHLFQPESDQLENDNKGGLVSIELIPQDEDNEKDELYCTSIHKAIGEARDNGFSLKDICVLVRTKNKGRIVAEYLLEQDIPVVSEESLLLVNNRSVEFLVALLEHCRHPDDQNIHYTILSYLNGDAEERHDHIQKNLENLHDLLESKFDFSFPYFKQLPVYNALQYAMGHFKMPDEDSAYLINLLAEALTVERQTGAGINNFLDHWDRKKEKLGISTPEDINAIRIMTIHKAKGLEFPVVIYPFANTALHPDWSKQNKLWVNVPKEDFNGFPQVLVNKSQVVAQIDDSLREVYQKEHDQEELDAFNLLYVVLTRAIAGLYIISEMPRNPDRDPPDRYSHLFISYLKQIGEWDESRSEFRFGKLPSWKSELGKTGMAVPLRIIGKDRHGPNIVTRSNMLWDSKRAEALARGESIHALMELIYGEEDLEHALVRLERAGKIKESEIPGLKQKALGILGHPELKAFYSSDLLIKNECDIIGRNGVILRPDRLVIRQREATIIDYKTGTPLPGHQQQLIDYGHAVSDMGYEVKGKVLVYIGETIETTFI